MDRVRVLSRVMNSGSVVQWSGMMHWSDVMHRTGVMHRSGVMHCSDMRTGVMHRSVMMHGVNYWSFDVLTNSVMGSGLASYDSMVLERRRVMS